MNTKTIDHLVSMKATLSPNLRRGELAAPGGLDRMRPALAGCLLLTVMLTGGTVEPTKAQAPATVGASATSQGGVQIKFTETDHDFGKIKSGAVVKFDFVFTNTGTAPLEISAVRPSCGCTTAGAWSKSVQPGQTGTIPIQFSSAGFAGPVHKTVSVTSNATGQPQIVLNLQGTVWREVDINPPTAYFTLSPDARTVESKVIRIVNNMDEALELEAPQCANPAFTAELTMLKPGKEFELRVSAVPPFKPGAVQASITLKTSLKNMPVLTVTGFIMVQQAIMAMPAQIVLGPAPLAASTKQVVTLRNLGGAAVTVSEPAVNVLGVEAVIQELQPGRVFSVAVNFPVGFELKRGVNAELSVKTSHPQFPIVRVPISQTPHGFQPPSPAVPSLHPAVASGQSVAQVDPPQSSVIVEVPIASQGSPQIKRTPPPSQDTKTVAVTPSRVCFTPQVGGKALEINRVRIVNRSDEPLELAPPECANKAFSAELRTLQKGKEFELLVSANPPFGPGVVKAPITLKTSSKDLPVISIEGIIVARLPIAVVPPQLLLGPTPLATATKLEVTLRNSGSTLVTFSDPAANVPGVTAAIQEVQPGRIYKILVDFPIGFAVKPGTQAELTVKTSHPQYPDLRVPILQSAETTPPQPVESYSRSTVTGAVAIPDLPSPSKDQSVGK